MSVLPECLHCKFIHTDIRSTKDGEVDCLIVSVSTNIAVSLLSSEKGQNVICRFNHWRTQKATYWLPCRSRCTTAGEYPERWRVVEQVLRAA